MDSVMFKLFYLACHVSISITIIVKLVTTVDIIPLANNNQWTFCNMTAIAAGLFTFSCAGVGGEWRRIASFYISAGDDYPTGWNKSSLNDFSFCRLPSITQ